MSLAGPDTPSNGNKLKSTAETHRVEEQDLPQWIRSSGEDHVPHQSPSPTVTLKSCHCSGTKTCYQGAETCLKEGIFTLLQAGQGQPVPNSTAGKHQGSFQMQFAASGLLGCCRERDSKVSLCLLTEGKLTQGKARALP